MTDKICYHCGDEVIGKGYFFDEKPFCCNGCKTVYQLLKDNNLGSFYTLEANAGAKPSESNQHKYAFLEVESIKSKFIDFEDDVARFCARFISRCAFHRGNNRQCSIFLTHRNSKATKFTILLVFIY